MGVPWGCLFIEFRYSMLQQYRELQLAFDKKKHQLIIWQTIVQKNSLQIMAGQFTFFWLHFIHFIRWEWKFHKLSQIYTESDKLSFYKAPPGHLIRTKTVQTWFLRDSPGMFFSVCAGKTCNYQKKLFILQRFAK
jgi:hypothetical protein